MRLGLGISIPGTSGLVQAAFSPLDLSPVLWLDASDTSTITEVGGSVSQLDDKSGNGYDVAQATGANQPLSGSQTLNGLNVLEYDSTGDNQQLNNASINFYNVRYTSFYVADIAAGDTYHIFHSASGGVYALVCQSGSASGLISNGVTRHSLHVNGVAQTPTNRGQAYTAVGTSPAIVRIDATQTSNTAGFFLNYPSGGTWSHGSLFGELIVAETPTADEITATEQYLAQKWGITLP